MASLPFAMVYVGSAVMVLNIALYLRLVRTMSTLPDWRQLQHTALVPFALLILFLAGYLSVALVGRPDMVVAGILLGGSVFVLLIVGIIHRILKSLVEGNNRVSARYEQTQKSLEGLTRDFLTVLRVNLTNDIIEERGGTNLRGSDLAATSYTEFMAGRQDRIIADPGELLGEGRFTREGLIERFERGESTVDETVFCRVNDDQVAFVNLKATLVAQPGTGDVLAFITEELGNDEAVNEALLNKALIGQYDMICYLVGGRYGVVIGDDSAKRPGSIFPREKNGNYWDYLADQVAPVMCGTPEESIRSMSSLGLNRVERELAEHEPYEVNITCQIDGQTFHKRFVFYVVDPEARFYLLLKSDTTELIRGEAERAKRLEEALEEARLASQAKTTFLANMSHDIRTPMNAIVGYTELARKSEDGVQVGEYLDKIDSSGKYLLALINDVLEMSRIESGGLDLQLEPVDLVAIVDEATSLFSQQMAEKGLALSIDVGTVRDRWVRCDKVRLGRLLHELVGNACKFTPEGGSVKVALGQGPDRLDGRAGYELRVKDTGVGVSPEFIDKVFDAFERERTTTESGIQGTGLGLAIVKRIVDAMGGTISVESEVGAGTEFVVGLCLERADVMRSAAGDDGADVEDEFDFAGLRVLLADDNEINREIAAAVLEELGCSVECVENGQQVLDTLCAVGPGGFDLVITDVQMPVMDGYEETRAIRALPDAELSRIPIIAMSANVFAEDVRKGMDLGMDGYLPKPIDVEAVIETVKEVMGRTHRA